MNPAQHLLTFAVRLYRWTLSPAKTALFGPLGHCRFEPTCSAYALEAIQVHGAVKGTWLALKRIGRCHPWGDCGHDPVPVKRSEAPQPVSTASLLGGQAQSGISAPAALCSNAFSVQQAAGR